MRFKLFTILSAIIFLSLTTPARAQNSGPIKVAIIGETKVETKRAKKQRRRVKRRKVVKPVEPVEIPEIGGDRKPMSLRMVPGKNQP